MTATQAASTSLIGSSQYLDLSMALALELVSGLTKPSEVFSRHGFTKKEAADMLGNPQFKRMLREAKSIWDSDANAEERIRMKAKLALEELLPTHFALATSPDTPAAARNEAVKTFERLSGVSRTEADGGGGSRFSVVINLGEDKTLTIDAPASNALENDE